MIQNPFANLTPVVKNLLMINIVFFVGTYALQSTNVFDMDRWLSVPYFASPDFRLWQIISYMFMHGGLWHILFNMFALVSFGPIVEQTLGSKRFLSFYFICGLGAIGLQMMVQAYEVYSVTGHLIVSGVNEFNVALRSEGSPFLNYAMPGAQKLFDVYNSRMVGASGAIFGVLAAFGMLYPNLEMMVMPIPVPIKAKILIPIYVVLEIVLGIGNFSGDSVAHFAHIGGALIGFIVIKLWGYRSDGNFF